MAIVLSWIIKERISSNFEASYKVLGPEFDGLGTPLYYTSEAGLFELMRMLIEGSMDVNVQDGQFGNALQAASYSGEIKVVQLLVDNKADVNAQGG